MIATDWAIRFGGMMRVVASNEEGGCHVAVGRPGGKTRRATGDSSQGGASLSCVERTSSLGQVWRFAREIQKGDLVALPIKTAAFAFGRVIGEYEYKQVAPNVMHIRRVEWLKTVPTSDLPKDILLSLRGMLTVFKVTRNNAEGRVKTILALSSSASEAATEIAKAEIDGAAGDDRVNLEEAARDEILQFIQEKFKGHDLARLVDAVLRAQGYKTEVSPPSPDGGVDILAGSGPLGFDQPCLCVQVKSGKGTEGQKTFNELLGVVSKFASQQGLLVS